MRGGGVQVYTWTLDLTASVSVGFAFSPAQSALLDGLGLLLWQVVARAYSLVSQHAKVWDLRRAAGRHDANLGGVPAAKTK
eukprot:scaffold1988_cov255-Pinguiococcus_pyrenoidosus.AAC.10